MKKIICKMSAVLIATVSMVSMGMVNAGAFSGDTSEYPWSVGSNDLRRKYTSSSIYVENYGGTSVYMNVYGKTLATSTVKLDVGTYGEGYFETYGLTIPANSQRLVRQFIREKNYNFAYVEFWSTATNSSTGVWSPDFDTSTGSFPNAN